MTSGNSLPHTTSPVPVVLVTDLKHQFKKSRDFKNSMSEGLFQESGFIFSGFSAAIVEVRYFILQRKAEMLILVFGPSF